LSFEKSILISIHLAEIYQSQATRVYKKSLHDPVWPAPIPSPDKNKIIPKIVPLKPVLLSLR